MSCLSSFSHSGEILVVRRPSETFLMELSAFRKMWSKPWLKGSVVMDELKNPPQAMCLLFAPIYELHFKIIRQVMLN